MFVHTLDDRAVSQLTLLQGVHPDVVFAQLNSPSRAAVLVRAISRVPASVIVSALGRRLRPGGVGGEGSRSRR